MSQSWQSSDTEEMRSPLSSMDMNRSHCHQSFESDSSTCRLDPYRYFRIIWGKMSARVHKKFEGDGFMRVRGRQVELYDEVTKQQLAAGKNAELAESAGLANGKRFGVSGKLVEIVDEITEGEYQELMGLTAVEAEPAVSTVPARPIRNCPRFNPKPFVTPFKRDDSPESSTPQLDKLSYRFYPASQHKTKNSSQMASAKGAEKTTTAQSLVSRPPPREEKPPLIMPRPPVWHNTANQPVNDVIVDSFLSNFLREHQREGVKFLYETVMGFKRTQVEECPFLGGAILADEMGLGKTLQTIAVIWTLFKKGPYKQRPIIKKVLLVCPATLIKNWQSEFNKWLGAFRIRVLAAEGTPAIVDSNIKDFTSREAFICGVLIISYDRLIRSGFEKFLNMDKKIDLLVCDEAHVMKNEDAQKCYRLKQLDVGRRIFLTGTPVQNNMKEFFTICDLVNPGIFGSKTDFRERFEDPISKGQDPNADDEEKEWCKEQSKKLNDLTSMFMLRRTSEVIQKYLPDKTEYVVFCRPSEFQLKLLSAVGKSRQVQQLLNNFTGSPPFASIDYMRKICNHPYIFYESAAQANSKEAQPQIGNFLDSEENSNGAIIGENSQSQLILRDELMELFVPDYLEKPLVIDESGKLQMLLELLTIIREEQPRDKVVIVSYFTKTLNLIERVCKSKKFLFATLRLDGQTVSTKRLEIVQQFNNPNDNHTILLLSSKAGGTGLNLIGANRLIMFEPDWNPANDQQALARVWRDGQKRAVHLYRFLTTGSIDEKIYQRQLKKQNICGVALGNQSASLGENENEENNEEVSVGFNGNIPKFTLDELRDLFSIHEATRSLTHDLIECKCLTEEGPPEKKAKRNVQMTELFDWEHKIVPLDTWPDSCLQYSDVTCTMAFRNLTVTSVINETMNDGSEKNQEAGNDELAK